ncbi:hypothetical protein B0J17DRAFT_296891 [Rhizoctonia solani]|nr:hypothetical protein B0J17DRAFT_296891 [Rhizoctonia solani]
MKMLGTRASPCPAVQRWEDAHTCLLSALTAYMDTCMNLKNSSLSELSTNAESLVPRIERHITSLSSFVAYQIFQIRSVLSTAQSQIASPIYALPEEVLVEIFSQVIYLPADNQPPDQSMEQDLRSIYRRLYNLIGVCTSWRNTAVRKRGFWSIIPMIDKCKCSHQPLEEVTERSLRRSGGTGLYIAMSTSLRLPTLLRPLLNYGKHIRALNIQTESRRTMKEVMSTLAVFASPETLTNLSIYLKPTVEFRDSTDAGWEVIRQPSQHQERHKKILGSLRALRIRVAHIDLYGLTFTNLVELRIEEVRLGFKSAFKRLLGAISSATNLQYLQLVSVSSYLDDEFLFDVQSSPPNVIDDNEQLIVSLPNLKLVFLADMFFNDLKDIFQTFTPGNENHCRATKPLI